MIAARITPKVAWLGCMLNLGAWMTVHLPWLLGWTPRLSIAEGAIKLTFLSSAYLMAFLLNWEIAREHRQVQCLRVAWLALAANAGLSVIRVVIENPLRGLIWEKGKYS